MPAQISCRAIGQERRATGSSADSNAGPPGRRVGPGPSSVPGWLGPRGPRADRAAITVHPTGAAACRRDRSAAVFHVKHARIVNHEAATNQRRVEPAHFEAGAPATGSRPLRVRTPGHRCPCHEAVGDPPRDQSRLGCMAVHTTVRGAHRRPHAACPWCCWSPLGPIRASAPSAARPTCATARDARLPPHAARSLGPRLAPRASHPAPAARGSHALPCPVSTLGRSRPGARCSGEMFHVKHQSGRPAGFEPGTGVGVPPGPDQRRWPLVGRQSVGASEIACRDRRCFT